MPDVSHHLMIGGAGRSGTTMLVQYLTQIGLDTTLSRHPATNLNRDAEAGLEAALLHGDGAEHPYVIKDPWLFEYASQLLKSPKIQIDGLILPIRSLRESAASRVILERRAIHEAAPWMKNLDESWDNWAATPGGITYSLNPVDQERTLAVGFYNLVEKFCKADIPVVILHFDRMIEEQEYIYKMLKPLLPPTVTREQALAAHQAVVDRTKARVGRELATNSDSQTLDRTALIREIGRLNRELEVIRTAPPMSFWSRVFRRRGKKSKYIRTNGLIERQGDEQS